MGCIYKYEGKDYTEQEFRDFVGNTMVQKRSVPKYNKILFPTGDTASKVEGHETIEEFKKQKEERIIALTERKNNLKIIERESSPYKWGLDSDGITTKYLTKEDAEFEMFSQIKSLNKEIDTTKEELKRVESEGFAALKPIYNFYENRVYRELEKMYSKEGVTRIKDSYGNEWYEVEIVPEVDKQVILAADTTKGLSSVPYEPLEALDIILKSRIGKALTEVIIDGKRGNYSMPNGFDNQAQFTRIENWIKDNSAFDRIRVEYNIKTNTISFLERKLTYGTRTTANRNTGRLLRWVSFPLDTTGITGYKKRASSLIEELSKDKRVLFTSPDRTGSIVPGQRSVEPNNFIKSSPTDSAVLGKTLKELFDNPIERGKPLGMSVFGMFIASRLLQQSDSFIGRVASSIRKDKLGNSPYVILENDPSKPALFSNRLGIYINVAKLDYFYDNYATYNDMIRGLEAALTEEVIHFAVENIATEEELTNVYKEMSVTQRDAVKRIYKASEHPYTIVSEYLRMIIQNEVFGTITEQHSKTRTEIGIFQRFLDYLISLFKNNQTPASKVVVDKVKNYIDRSTGKIQNTLFQLSAGSTELPIKDLDNIIKRFVTAMGGNVTNVDNIVINGKKIDAVAVVDILNKSIQIADGKADITTLPEEAVHLFIELLPANHPLLKEMLADIKKKQVYQDVLAEYGTNEFYLNPDGTINTDKIAKEAIGKHIAAVIVGRYKDTKSMSFWKRLWRWISERLAGKKLDAYTQVAKDILGGKLSKIEETAAKKANKEGRYWFQLPKNTNAIVQGIAATGTKQQKEIIRDLVIEPKVTFIENKVLGIREYRSTIIGNEGRTYPGFSSQLAVEGPPNPEEYEINRQWGEDLDSILAGVILNQKLSDISTPTLNDTIRQKAYDLFEDYLAPYKEAGYVAVPQVIVYDDAANIASAIDLLLISPTGALKVVDLKSSWTSAANIQKYKGTAWPLLPTSRVISDTQSISKFRQHNVQVNTYNKMLRLMGYQDIEDAAIKNIQIMYRENNGVYTATDIKEDNDQTTAGTGYVKERVVDPSAEEELVDLMVPVAVDYTKDNLETWGIKPKITNSTEPESKPYERVDEELTADEKTSLSKQFSEIFEALKQYRTLLADRKAKASNAEEKTDRSKALDTLEEVMSTMLAAVDNTKNGREIAYTQFLLYINKGLKDIIEVLSKEENKHNPLYLHWTIMAEAFVTQFQGYTGLFKFSNKRQEWNNLITDIADKLRTVQPIIIDSYRQGVLTSVIKKYSTRDVILESLVEKDTDLTNMAARFIDMANSRNAILENLDKSFKHDVELIRESTDAIDNRIVDAANQVIKAFGKKDASVFEPLFEKDRDGNKTGRFISAIGPLYWEKEEALREPLLDENGQYKEYIKNPKTKEDLQYNKELAAARKNSYMFWTAEDRVYDEQTRQYSNVEGTYHRYTKEYQDARNEVMRWDSTEGKWVPKTTNAAYWNFINKYHSAKVGYYIADRKKNSKGIYEYTGTLTYVDAVRYTPHPQYKEILETSNDGQDMSNPAYKKLQRATDAKSVALWNFFNVYRDILSEQQEVLPTYTNSWFSRNNIPRVQANWMNMLAKEGSNKGAMISSQIKSFFEITAYTHQPAVAMTGDSSQQLPLLFMGRLRDQAVVQRLKTQLAKHNSIDTAKMSPIEKRAWKQEQSRIEENIKIENARITAADIEPDLVEGLRAFVQMSQSFKIKRAAEDRITAVKKTIDNMVFIQEKKNMLGKVISTKEVAGVDSNAKQRLSDYLAMNYYSGEAVSKEFLDIVADRLMKVTSTIGLGFNVFSWANNVTTGVLNNYIDAYGGEFYQKRSLNRMKKESTLAIGALVRHKMDSVINKTLGYNKQKPVSKYEALSQKFNMIEHHIQAHSGKVDWVAKLGGFSGMEKGEWLVQSMVGNAILDSIQVEYTGSNPAKKGSKKSLYDAYEFDEKTGTVTLEEGYELSDHDRRDIINRIRETNKRIHGNYRAIDKIVIEKEWWGRIMMQYHKWVIPAYSARFRKLKYDENLGGGMHIEGRWRSAGKFLMALKDRTITLQTLIDTVNTDYTKMDPAAQKQWLLDVWGGLITAEEWEKMSDEEKTSLIAHRKNNLLKDLMDLVYIALLSVLGILIAYAAKGLDDDDEEVKKLLNFFRYQADRSTAELALFVPILGIIEGYQLVKNTVASTSIIKEAGELTKALIQFPFLADSEKTIQRGPNKGRYKVAKEAGDIIPIIKQLQRWNAFETTKEFWVK